MSYLPPGWTQERLSAATIQDLEQLPYETLHRIDPTIIQDTHAQDLIFGARIDERTRRIREQSNLPAWAPRFKRPAPQDPDPAAQEVIEIRNQRAIASERELFTKDPAASLIPEPKAPVRPSGTVDPIVQLVEEGGFDDFGFMIIRLEYGDESAFDQWSAQFDGPIDRSLEESAGGERIAEKAYLPVASDPDLQGTGTHGAVCYWLDCRENDMIKPGLDMSMCLAIDKAAIDSVLNPVPGQLPWIWAIDLKHEFQIGDQLVPEGRLAAEYPGYFKVALESVLTELYPMLATSMVGNEIWEPGVEIWTGLSTSTQD